VPSTASVASGDYPLTRELNLVFKAEHESLLAGILKFAQSSEAAELVAKQFFVPVQH
jgi:phosphate transport system substrate-binding protein